MCEVTTAMVIGAAVGGGIGYSKGGAKGALLGAGFGAVGGYGFGVATGIGGASIFAPAVPGATTGAAAGMLGGGISPTGVALTTAPSSFLGGAFGTGGIGSFLTSPGFALGTQVVGFGVNMMGQQQQRAYQQAMIENQQAQLRNRMLAADQDITANNARLEVQLGIISGQGAVGRGAIRTEQAGRGVLTDVGSAADRTAQFAADVAYKKELTAHDVALQNRQTTLISQGLQAESRNLAFKSADISASAFGQTASSGLALAGSVSKNYRFNKAGQLVFRT
jgi:hypothetical protein